MRNQDLEVCVTLYVLGVNLTPKNRVNLIGNFFLSQIRLSTTISLIFLQGSEPHRMG